MKNIRIDVPTYVSAVRTSECLEESLVSLLISILWYKVSVELQFNLDSSISALHHSKLNV